MLDIKIQFSISYIQFSYIFNVDLLVHKTESEKQ